MVPKTGRAEVSRGRGVAVRRGVALTGRGRAGSFGWALNAPFSGEEGAVELTERPDEAEPVEFVDAVEKDEAELLEVDRDAFENTRLEPEEFWRIPGCCGVPLR